MKQIISTPNKANDTMPEVVFTDNVARDSKGIIKLMLKLIGTKVLVLQASAIFNFHLRIEIEIEIDIIYNILLYLWNIDVPTGCVSRHTTYNEEYDEVSSRLQWSPPTPQRYYAKNHTWQL
jgi:hypothetical protein